MPGTAHARNGSFFHDDQPVPEGIAVLELGPRYDSLDHMELCDLSERLDHYAHAEPPQDVVLDMTATSSIGARFAGIVLSAASRFKSDRRIALCGMNRFCSDVLAAVQAPQACPIYPNREEAVEALSQG